MHRAREIVAKCPPSTRKSGNLGEVITISVIRRAALIGSAAFYLVACGSSSTDTRKPRTPATGGGGGTDVSGTGGDRRAADASSRFGRRRARWRRRSRL